MLATNVEPLLCSVASCTETGVIVEDTTTGTPKLITLTSDNNANVWGSWVQLDAALNKDSWICFVTVFMSFVSGRQVLELGKGAGGSESPIARWSFKLVYLTAVGMINSLVFPLPIPIKVSAGTRLALRIADDVGGANDYIASAQYYQNLEV